MPVLSFFLSLFCLCIIISEKSRILFFFSTPGSLFLPLGICKIRTLHRTFLQKFAFFVKYSFSPPNHIVILYQYYLRKLYMLFKNCPFPFHFWPRWSKYRKIIIEIPRGYFYPAFKIELQSRDFLQKKYKLTNTIIRIFFLADKYFH